MAMMTLLNRFQSRALAGQLLLVILLHPIAVFAITSLSFYPNGSCEGTSSYATVSSISHDGPCDHPGGAVRSLAATVSGESQEYDCTVTVYSDPNCSNDAQAASLGGTCTTFAFTFESYSVDCISVNSDMGDIESSVSDDTNESETDAQTSTPSAERTSLDIGAISVGTSTISTTKIHSSSSATSSSPQKSIQPTSISSTFSTKASTSPPMPVTTNNNLMNHVSPPAAATTRLSHAPSSSATNTSTHSNNNSNTNLSRNGEIVIGVLIPSVAIIVAILIGIDQGRRYKKGETNMINLIHMLRNSRHGGLGAEASVFEMPARTDTRELDVPEGAPF